MTSITLDGRSIAFDDVGAGDPIVWLQGTGESRQGFVVQVDRFSETHRCVAIDHRDSGESSYVDEPYTPADLAADAAAVMDHLALGASHVLGYSLGGAAAQELAIGRPDLVRSLILVATWARSDEWFKAEMRNWQAIRRQYWDDEDAFLDAFGPWAWSPATYAKPGLVEGFHQAMLAEEPQQRPDGWIRQCDADIAHDAADRLGSVTVPALVIVGEDDICTPPRYARELCALLPNAELIAIPNAGHGAYAETPAIFIEAVAAFLAKH
ncbi:MAG: alpha/beta hydrolase [Actinomycetota bacterium]